MKEIILKGRKIKFYDSIKQLNIKRYQQNNKYLMIASEIGSDIEDFDKRNIEIIEFLKKGMLQDAVKTMENRRQMFWNAMNNYNPKQYALALLVHSIDGKIKDDISENGLQETIDELDRLGFTYGDMVDTITEVKKKSKRNSNLIFLIISKIEKTKLYRWLSSKK